MLWAAAQKLGASAAMSIGVGRGLYARRALAVAGFDFAVRPLLPRLRPPAQRYAVTAAA